MGYYSIKTNLVQAMSITPNTQKKGTNGYFSFLTVKKTAFSKNIILFLNLFYTIKTPPAITRTGKRASIARLPVALFYHNFCCYPLAICNACYKVNASRNIKFYIHFLVRLQIKFHHFLPKGICNGDWCSFVRSGRPTDGEWAMVWAREYLHWWV